MKTMDVRRQRLVLFLGLGPMVGFTLGTITLIGPVRWVTQALRMVGAGETWERLFVLPMIVALVAVTVKVSWMLAARVLKEQTLQRRAVIPGAVTLVTLATLWVWFTPSILTRGAVTETLEGTVFTFGPYPDEETLQRLKDHGYTDVVSLLHPAVIPFEPVLLAKERVAAAAVGINLLHAPMLPWIGNNEESLELIRNLARNAIGKYYIHCYLGRDRIGVARRIIEAEARGLVAPLAPGVALASVDHLERGPVKQLDPGVFLIPYPTDEEFLSFLLGGDIEHVVSLLDPDNENDVQWLEHDRDLFDLHDLPYSNMPVPGYPYDAALALAVARQVRSLPRPVVIYAFQSNSPSAEGFEFSFLSDVAALPPSLFRRPLAAGPMEMVAANVVAGPTPTGQEFGSVLKRRGLRAVAFAGPEDVLPNEGALREAALPWARLDITAPDPLAVLRTGGPWYLYGPQLDSVLQELERWRRRQPLRIR